MNKPAPPHSSDDAAATRKQSPIPSYPGQTTRADLPHRVRQFVTASKAPRTQVEYAKHWADFTDYCSGYGHAPLPANPLAVVDYLTELADLGRSPSTIQVKLSAIAHYHKGQGFTNPATYPEVATIMAGIRRADDRAPQQKSPITRAELSRLLAVINRDEDNSRAAALRAARDRAMILLGYALATRASELVAIKFSDITFTDDGGMTLRLHRAKTGHKNKKTIPPLTKNSPTLALREWLALARITSGPIFRAIDQWGHIRKTGLTKKEVSRLVKRLCLSADLNPTKFSGHSLRAGLVTQAARDGKSLHAIKDITDHKSDAVLGQYIRDAGRNQADVIRAALES